MVISQQLLVTFFITTKGYSHKLQVSPPTTSLGQVQVKEDPTKNHGQGKNVSFKPTILVSIGV